MLILCTFVALWAPVTTCLWAALILGFLTDCLTRLPAHDGSGMLTLLGPNALGFCLAAYTVTQIRPVLRKDSIWTIPVSVLLGGLLAALLTVMLITGRGVYTDPIPGWHGLTQLMTRVGSLVYTCIVALPVAWALSRSLGLWSFESQRNTSAGSTWRQPSP
jgi:cell shape-determining protein MreD